MSKIIQAHIAYGILLMIFIALGVLFYSIEVEYPLPITPQEPKAKRVEKRAPAVQEDPAIMGEKRQAIEAQYPEFKDHENQDSFAGTTVDSKMTKDGSHYFAFIVNGSGVPVAQATCFRVDRMNRVYKVGEFPDMTDSYAGYDKIDPVTCAGIK